MFAKIIVVEKMLDGKLELSCSYMKIFHRRKTQAPARVYLYRTGTLCCWRLPLRNPSSIVHGEDLSLFKNQPNKLKEKFKNLAAAVAILFGGSGADLIALQLRYFVFFGVMPVQ